MPCDIKYQFDTAEAFNALSQSPAREANARLAREPWPSPFKEMRRILDGLSADCLMPRLDDVDRDQCQVIGVNFTEDPPPFTEFPKAAAAWKVVAEAMGTDRGKRALLEQQIANVPRDIDGAAFKAVGALLGELFIDFVLEEEIVARAIDAIRGRLRTNDYATTGVAVAVYHEALARRSTPKLMGRPNYRSRDARGVVCHQGTNKKGAQ